MVLRFADIICISSIKHAITPNQWQISKREDATLQPNLISTHKEL